MVKNHLKLTLILFSIIPLNIFFTNCAGQNSDADSSQVQAENQFGGIEGLPEVNYFKTNPPADMSGQAGYEFLMKEYFVPHCASCHGNGGVWQPNFANIDNVRSSYSAAKYQIPTENMIRRITSTANCMPECRLDERGEVYRAIMYWLEHRN